MVVGESSEVCSNWTSPVTLDSPRKTATIKKKECISFSSDIFREKEEGIIYQQEPFCLLRLN